MEAAIDYRTYVASEPDRPIWPHDSKEPRRHGKVVVGTNVRASTNSGPTVVDIFSAYRWQAEPALEQGDNWLSRINQIKAEIENLAERLTVPLTQPPASSFSAIDYLVTAMAGSKEPVFEVDPADGEISILWNDPQRRASVSINIDGSDDIRVVGYFSDLTIQPPVRRLKLRGSADADAVLEILMADNYRDVVSS